MGGKCSHIEDWTGAHRNIQQTGNFQKALRERQVTFGLPGRRRNCNRTVNRTQKYSIVIIPSSLFLFGCVSECKRPYGVSTVTVCSGESGLHVKSSRAVFYWTRSRWWAELHRNNTAVCLTRDCRSGALTSTDVWLQPVKLNRVPSRCCQSARS